MNVVQGSSNQNTCLIGPLKQSLELSLNFETKLQSEIVPCRDDLQPSLFPTAEHPQLWGINFKPREAKNMPVRDKVSQWLDNLPWVEVEAGFWVLDSFPGVPSTISRSSGFLGYSDDQEFREKQAREITRVITEKYVNNGEMPARPMTFGYFTEKKHPVLEDDFEGDLSY